ncbi:pH regulation protein F [Terasakiella brassicae]|uniref:PH regulation protein F n=1 Tax=Terasakiella brassicae TaxID=1634917 RepID=A0A917BNN0_9PROT|nr:monovalent cation/H+ antiporter complex subunit F [Terasakiella brassicae]GGF51825.1 pH regulation protein F [Terasakiella brassicae]
MYIAAVVAILIAIALGLVRASLGPTIYDRILAVNKIGTLTVLLIAVHGFLAGRPEFLDIALVYALINFIGTIAVLKYFSFKDLGHDGRDSNEAHKEDA